MGFKCGIIGLPNVGKSTIFNALTAQNVPASNYPFCTVDPNFGTVPLPDPRLNIIQKIIGSAKSVPTTLEFVDIAGLVKGASRGEGLGNKFLSFIQLVDSIAHIVRCFEDENISHTNPEIDPENDSDIVNLELILKDMDTIKIRIRTLKRIALTGDKKAREEIEILESVQKQLDQGKLITELELSEQQQRNVQPLNLLSAKPVLYIANVDEDHKSDNKYSLKLQRVAEKRRAAFLQFCGKAQAEIAELDPESQKIFLEELDLDEIGLEKLVRAEYNLLNLITFFTANENETHAWTVSQGTNVQKAAGKIHSDFEQGFIKAEVMRYNDLENFGSEQLLREKGLVAKHGRDYIVNDGDIIFYRFKSGD